MTRKIGIMVVFFLALVVMNMGCSSSRKFSKIKKKRPELINGPRNLLPTRNFVDMTEDYGLSGVKGTSLYAVDFNGDGWTDLVTMPGYYSIPEFYEFDCLSRKFKKIVYSPFNQERRFFHLYFVDLDNDGIMDIIGSNLEQKTELKNDPVTIYRGELLKKKIKYIEIKNALSDRPPGPSSIALVDFDLDGKLDLYLGNWYSYSGKKPEVLPDRLYKGDGFKFKNISAHLTGEYSKRIPRSRKYHMAKPTFGVSTCDMDQNGWPDILTVSSGGFANKMWINSRGKDGRRIYMDHGVDSMYSFDLDGRLMPQGGGNTFFSSCVDYNNDGYMDIFVGELTHHYDLESRDRSSMLTGARKSLPLEFLRDEFILTSEDESWTRCDRRAVWMDYNVDGFVDFLVDNSGFPPSSRLILFKQNNDHSYEDVSGPEGIDIVNPTGSVRIDLNEDGLWDIITGQSNIRNNKIPNRLYVFENRHKRNGKRSIRFFLHGKDANRDGLGAMVILKTKNKSMRQWVEYAKGPFQSQNEKGILFGLGKEDDPVFVKVRWPVVKSRRGGRAVVLSKVYSMALLDFEIHSDITLCESGSWHVGKTTCD